MNGLVVAVTAGLILMVIGAAAKAFGLPIVSSMVRAWVWVFTLGLPAQVRNDKRAEMQSELWEHRRDAGAEGYGPDAVALHMLLRFLMGMPGDVVWRLGQPGFDYAILIPAWVLIPAGVLTATGLLVAHRAAWVIMGVQVVLLVATVALVVAVLVSRRRWSLIRGRLLRQTGPPDFMLMLATAALIVMGLLVVYSAGFPIGQADYGDTNYFVARQAAYALIGLLMMSIFMQLDYHRLRDLSVIMMFVALAAMLAVLIPGIGIDENGARRWLSLGPLPPLQPGEFAKLAIIIYIAFWLSSRGYDVKRFSMGFLPFALMVSLVASLVIVEPDMGTGIIILLTTSTLFFVARASLTHLGLLVIAGGLITTALIWIGDYGWPRLVSFLGLGEATGDERLVFNELLERLSSGGATGVGWGGARQDLPVADAHTYGTLAIIGQEMGFVGMLALLSLYFFLAYRGFRVALTAQDPFGSLLALGVTCWIAYQVLVNIGGITGSIPLTGALLPFVSYGGSSLIATLIGVGLVLNISRHQSFGANPHV